VRPLPGAPDLLELPGLVILGELGRGNDTVVYRARRDTDDGVARPDYAVKVLGLMATVAAERLVTFRREAALLACVDHPGVVRVHTAGELHGRPYLVMELVEGRELADVLHAGQLSEAAAARLGAALADALGAAHHAGLVHRDIKPQNIMVQANGSPMLIDFGLASGGRPAEAARIVAGTVAYCPPEQSGLLHRPVDGRSDLYSLGVLLYECVTGRLPFVAADVGELLHLHATAGPPDPRTFAPELSAEFVAILGRLLAKDPDDRYPSAGALAADLRALLPRNVPAPGAMPLGFEARTPVTLVGRERELGALFGHWNRALSGAGAVVMIGGPAGIGKTRLVDELAAVVVKGGQAVLTVRAMEGAAPLSPIRAAIDQYVRAVDRRPYPERGPAVAQLAEAARDLGGLLEPLSPALTALLGLRNAAEEQPRHQFPSAVASFLAGLARGCGGLLIRVEDADQLDTASLRVLEQLVLERFGCPLLLVGTARTGVDDAGEAVNDLVDERILLGPLQPPVVAELVDRLSGRMDLGAEFASRLATASAGNPMTVHQYFQAAIEGGLVRPSWGRWSVDLDRLAEVALPTDAMQLLVRRLAGLTGPARAILVAASALGVRFDPDLLAEIIGAPKGDVQATLDEAGRLHVVERRGGDYAFVHSGIRAALLNGADRTVLAAFHQRTAELLTAADHEPGASRIYALARHRLRGQIGRDPDAVIAACFAAARQALGDYSPAEAVGYLDHVDRVSSQNQRPVPPGYAETLAVALHQSGRYVEALGWLDEAVRHAGDPLERGRLLVLTGQVHLSRWDPKAAEKALREALATLGQPLPESRARLALSTALRVLLAKVVPHGRARGENRERLRLTARAYANLSNAALVGMRPRRVPIYALQAVLPAARLGPTPEYVEVQGLLGAVYDALGREKAARRAFASAEAAAERLDQPQLRAQVALARQQAKYMRGQVASDRQAGLLDRQGHWLDLFHYLNATAIFCWQRLVNGEVTTAAVSYRRALRRLILSDEDDITFLLVGVAIAAAGGRLTVAAEQLGHAREAFSLSGLAGPGIRVNLAWTTAQVSVEANEVGQDFDAALGDFAALRLRLDSLLPVQRSFFVYQAYGRLEQARRVLQVARADPTEALAAAERAVTALAEVAQEPHLQVHAEVAKAELNRLRGDPGAALDAIFAVAGRINAAGSLLAEYEAGRVRARAMLALGDANAARRAARDVADLAAENGWPHRADWVRAEFDLGRHLPIATHDPDWDISRSTVDRERLAAMEQVSRAASRVLDPAELTRVGLDECIRILRAERGLLFLTDDTTGKLALRLGRSARREDLMDPADYASTLVDRVKNSRRELVVTGTEDGAALGSDSVLLYGLRSVVVAPLELDGRLLGVVYLDSRVATGVFRPSDAGILTAICGQVAAALETARAAQLATEVTAAAQERDVAERLRAAMTAVSGTLDPAAVLLQLYSSLANVLPGETSWLVLLDGDEVLVTDGQSDVAPLGEPAGSELAAVLAAANAPVVMAAPSSSSVARPELTSWLVMPLNSPDRTVGAVLIAAKSADAFRQSNLGMAAALVEHGMTAYQNAVLFRRVTELATVDGLTGAASRRHFFEQGTRLVASAPRYGLAAMMVDIDHFKRVNDTYGHATGDQVIAAVAGRLRAVLSPDDLLGRYGGEEFAIVLCRQDAFPGEVGEALRAAVSAAPVETESGALVVTVSVGIAVPAGAAAVAPPDLASLLGRADEALYEAKGAGRNRVVVYGPMRATLQASPGVDW
jgi:diguanylate cyclase (GGDEF)-like protein